MLGLLYYKHNHLITTAVDTSICNSNTCLGGQLGINYPSAFLKILKF